jgi:hypothetical protein
MTQTADDPDLPSAPAPLPQLKRGPPQLPTHHTVPVTLPEMMMLPAGVPAAGSSSSSRGTGGFKERCPDDAVMGQTSTCSSAATVRPTCVATLLSLETVQSGRHGPLDLPCTTWLQPTLGSAVAQALDRL